MRSNSERRRARQTHFNAEGQAALMVAESILIALIEHNVLTKMQLVEAIDTAISTKRQMAEDGQDPEVSRIAAGLIAALQTSIASFANI
ncbi:MAG: hypothetical protein JO320_22185 [Alphaproteobacteria bacterium]|nr:hypothetical protein [Alphaproteobacteria bacterium]